ncbi:unnamed protein product [Clavelina lepadiformis]|uniref:Protein sleepless n=1 Tax=Clavelina lepadiformis TaxID=159417 RepID=A0ABP0FJA9_CLALP
MIRKIFVKVGLLAALLFARGSAIQCYQCQHKSVTGGNICYGPNIDNKYLQTCPEEQDHCSTTVAILKAFDVEVTVIERNCSTFHAQASCPSVDSNIKSCVYFCSQDGCNNGNSGSRVQASLITLMLTMVGALALIKW